ncbi:MAG: glycosyltransferase [Bacteroidota bacterium]
MVIVIGFLILLVVGVYSVFQLVNLFFWWKATDEIFEQKRSTEWPTVDVVVPARNEARNLPLLLQDLQKLNYPSSSLQIVVVDDFSEDDTLAVARRFDGITVLQLSDRMTDPEAVIAHKKAALTYAIENSQAEVIVTTDADCRWPTNGLKALLANWQEGQFRSGSVLIETDKGFLYGFQSLDMMSYMFLTAAYAVRRRPILANGANLAIGRQLFNRIDGYTGVDHIASGDDVLLLHKLNSLGFAGRVRFMADSHAVVETKAAPSWSAFWQQRLRWAGKTGHYKNAGLVWAQGIAFAASSAIIFGLLLSIFDERLLTITVLAWMLKAGCDGIILRVLCAHFDRKEDFRWYLPSALLYPFYLLAIGVAALLGVKATWKGRRV